MLLKQKGHLVVCLALAWLSEEAALSEKGMTLVEAKVVNTPTKLPRPPSCQAYDRALELLELVEASDRLTTSRTSSRAASADSARHLYELRHGLSDSSHWAIDDHGHHHHDDGPLALGSVEFWASVPRTLWRLLTKVLAMVLFPVQLVVYALTSLLGIEIPGASFLDLEKATGHMGSSSTAGMNGDAVSSLASDPEARRDTLLVIEEMLDRATIWAEERDAQFWAEQGFSGAEEGKGMAESCEQAWGTRGMFYLIPPDGGSVNITTASESLDMHTQLNANSTSQFMLGYIHSAGLSPVQADQAQALLYYTFAAFQGLPEAEIALGYRHWAGIGVKEDCLTALAWYESAADKAYETFLTGPPGGKTLPMTVARLSDMAGGVYGPGASWASTGMNAHRTVIRVGEKTAAGESLDDVLEYYQYQSDRNNHRYTVALGRIYYTGSVHSNPGGVASGGEKVGHIGVDWDKARAFFLKVARIMWPTDIKLNVGTELPDGFGAKTGRATLHPDMMNDLKGPAATAAGYLGRMYLRGEGVPRDYLMARMWLKRGAELQDRESHNMLGIIYRDGLGVKPLAPPSVMKFFMTAAGAELAEAKVHLGKLHQQMKQPDQAMGLFSQAVASGNVFEGYYYLGKGHATTARSENPDTAKHSGVCGAAVSSLKLVVEKGRWAYPYLDRADEAWAKGETTKALMLWWVAAELGYEVAQNNVAYLLDTELQVRERRRRQRWSLKRLLSLGGGGMGKDGGEGGEAEALLRMVEDPAFAALTQWIRSAGQQNVDALVKVGDYHYNGIGLGPNEDRLEKAASTYQSAAETQTSAVAFWNLGWMYENGMGVPQDWHLAKRFYDLCGQTNHEAKLPVTLSLIKLQLRSLWAGLMSGDLSGSAGGGSGLEWGQLFDGNVLDEGELDMDGSGLMPGDQQMTAEDREAAELLAEYTRYRLAAGVAGAGDDDEEGLERRERLLRLGIDPADVDDYLEHVARHHHGGGGGGAGAGGVPGDEEEEELFEIGVILGLAGVLMGLMWLRGRWERGRREAQERERERVQGLQAPGVAAAAGADGAGGHAPAVPGLDNGEIPPLPI